jgi:hypothetical protein
MRTLLLGAVAATVFVPHWSAQEPPVQPPPAREPAPAPPLAPAVAGTAICATQRFVYVLRDDVLWQLDAMTLAVVRSTTFPPAASAPAGAVPPGPVAAPAAPAPEPPLPPPRPAKERAASIAAALQWLAAHQDPDGRWDCDQFMKHDPPGKPASDGPGNAVHDVGATGLAVLAMLADGSTPQRGQWQDNLKRAATWLKNQQQPNGLVGVNASHDFVYDHAIGALALCELYGAGGVASLKTAAQAAIDYLESHRNPYAVWRYQPRDNDNDTSVTTWAVLAITAADRVGLRVNRESLKLAAVWYDQVSTPDGQTGYTKRGEPSSRKPGDHAVRFPPERGEAMTAAAAVGRFAIGQTPATHPPLQAAVDRVANKYPQWEKGSIDAIYWFFGARAMQRIEGPHHDTWQRALGALVPAQRTDGAFAGSWDPVGVWDEDGGRVVATALYAMTLQAGLPSKVAPLK